MIHLYGGVGRVLQPDATTDFEASAEPDAKVVLLTKLYHPMGPEGDVLFRRVHITVDYLAQVNLTVVPIIDGREISGSVFSASAAGSGRRTWTVPVVRVASGRGYPVRGSGIQFRIESETIDSRWAIRSIRFDFHPGAQSSRRGQP